ncbi:MAG: hypothetical protein ACOZAR_00690 [Patescibacteria group bacterium]
MSLKTYFVGIAISTFLAWSAFYLTLTNIDPFVTDKAGMASFFVSMFLGILGLVILILIYFRSRVYSVAELYEKMPVILRQAFLVSFFSTAVIGMQAMRVLRWWTALMLMIIVILVEMSFYINTFKFEEIKELGNDEEKE